MANVNRTVAVIPARYGSTRFPGKPLALISGKPMIQRCYPSTRRCSLFADVIVATDEDGNELDVWLFSFEGATQE